MTGVRSRALYAAVLCGSAAFANAQTVSVDKGQLELRATTSTVGQVLRELAAHAPIRLLIDPAVDGSRVTTTAASGLRTDQALEAVLSASRLPYLVWGGAKGPWRVVVGDEASAVEVAAAPASPTSPPAEEDAGAPAGSSDAVAAYEDREAERSEKAALEREAEARPIAVTDAPGVPGGYTLTQENVTYNDPNFVPYKNRPEVQARRRAVDVTKIP